MKAACLRKAKKQAGKKRTKRIASCKAAYRKSVAAANSSTGAGAARPIRRVGQPAADNTGVIAGTGLTRHVGNLYVDVAGTVIEDRDIVGKLTVRAPRVVVRNSIIRGSATAPISGGEAALVITTAGASGYVVQDVTIVPQTPNVRQNGVNVNQSGVFDRVNVSGTVDGFMVFGSNVTITNSYAHSFVHYPTDPYHRDGSHNDAVQVQAGHNITISGNTLQGATNAAVMVTQDAGTTANLTITGNWIGGGTCSINYSSNGAPKAGMTASRNRFFRTQTLTGCALIANLTATPLVHTGNVWADTNTPVELRRGG